MGTKAAVRHEHGSRLRLLAVAATAGGIDPRAVRRLVRVVVEEWLAQREHTVSAKTCTGNGEARLTSRIDAGETGLAGGAAYQNRTDDLLITRVSR